MADAKSKNTQPDNSAELPAEKADITHADIVADPHADILAEDPKAPTGDLTVPRADSHDPRPAS